MPLVALPIEIHAPDGPWSLYRDDPRPPNQYPNHAVRVIVDRLASIGDMLDPSFPPRIVAWVDKQLALATDPRHATPRRARHGRLNRWMAGR